MGAYFILYIAGGICYHEWSAFARRQYGHLSLPMIFYSACSLGLGLLFFLFLQECYKSKKKENKMLLISTIALFLLSFMSYFPYMLFVPLLAILQKTIEFSPIAGFSFSMCLMMYIVNIKKFKGKTE